jgi:hypothetical protein
MDGPDLGDALRGLACEKLANPELSQGEVGLILRSAHELDRCQFLLRRVVPRAMWLVLALSYIYTAILALTLAFLVVRLGIYDWLCAPVAICTLASFYFFVRLFFLRGS